MFFPAIAKSSDLKFTLPPMRGGINKAEIQTQINDNQLSDAKNVIWKDGMLITRPSLNMGKIATFGRTGIYKVAENYVLPNGHTYTVCATDVGEYTGDRLGIRLIFMGTDIGFEGILYTDNILWDDPQSGEKNANVFIGKDNEIYILTDNACKTVKYNTLTSDFDVSDIQAYTPTVYKSAYTKANSNYDCGIEGAVFEERNTLTKQYKMVYTMYNPSVATNFSGTLYGHYMVYGLPYMMPENGTLTVKIAKNGTTVTHSVTWTGKGTGDASDFDRVYEDDFKSDHLKLGTNGKTFVLRYNGGGSNVAQIVEDNTGSVYYTNNEFENMTVETEYADDDLYDIHGTTVSCWYGGTAYGISGGSRLFVSGKKDDGNRVMWSAANDPTYFPADNYTLVGSSDTPVTAMAKQESDLVVFKTNSVFISRYNEGSYTEASNGVESNIAIFTFAQISDAIGCDLPLTVQLCNNNLVWTTKSKKVYVLTSKNQYSEKNIRSVSANIENDIAIYEGEIPSAFDFDGYYALSVHNRLYLLNYTSYAFISIAGNYNQKDGETLQEWFYCELPENEQYIFSQGTTGNISVVSSVNTTLGFMDVYYGHTEDNGVDTYNDGNTVIETRISQFIETKRFNLGSDYNQKHIKHLYIEFGNKDKLDADIQFITERGKTCNRYLHRAYGYLSEDPKFLQEYRVIVNQPRASRFGFRISFDGYAYIGGMTIIYSMIGGIR